MKCSHGKFMTNACANLACNLDFNLEICYQMCEVPSNCFAYLALIISAVYSLVCVECSLNVSSSL